MLTGIRNQKLDLRFLPSHCDRSLNCVFASSIQPQALFPVDSGAVWNDQDQERGEREREIALEVEKQRGLATIFGRWGLYREIREERECHAYAAERGVHGQNRDLGS